MSNETVIYLIKEIKGLKKRVRNVEYKVYFIMGILFTLNKIL